MKPRNTAALLSVALLFSLSACKSLNLQATPAPTPTPKPLTFTWENFPRLDGSAETVPLAQSLAGVMLDEFPLMTLDLTNFSGTDQAFQRLQSGKSNLLLVSDPPQEILDQLGQEGGDIQMEELATDGLVFVVHADNPVDSLTIDQLRDIYTGTITNWEEVGGEDAEILPFQSLTDTGSQALMDRLVMDGQEMTESPTDYTDYMTGMEEGQKSFDYSPNAIGYTFYRHTQDLAEVPGLKVVEVDGVSPSAQTVSDHTYPLSTTYYVAMSAQQDPDTPTYALYHWLLSTQGQRLLEGCASVSQKEEESSGYAITAHWERLEPINTPNAQRWYESYTDYLIPSEEYGSLVPYIGGRVHTYAEGNWLYGLATRDGVIVTDPVFDDAMNLRSTPMPWTGTSSPDMLLLTTKDQTQTQLGLAASDGSWYTGQIFQGLLCSHELGTLMISQAGDLVMVSPDGTQSPFHFSEDVGLPTLYPTVDWPYMAWSTDESTTTLDVYLDLRDGTVYHQAPADFQPADFPNGGGYFVGGRFQLDGTTLTIYPDHGDPHAFDVGEDCARVDINGDRVLLFYDTTPESFRLTDWNGNILLSGEDFTPYFLTYGDIDTPSLFTYNNGHAANIAANSLVLDRDGNPLFTTQGSQVIQYGDRLLYATQGHYILSDLSGNALLCLPRLDQ